MQDPLSGSFDDALDDVARSSDGMASGSVSALSAAFAAALVTMVARASRTDWIDAGGAIAQSEALRARLRDLAIKDAGAYQHARSLLARTSAHENDERAGFTSGVEEPTAEQRAFQLEGALDEAALVALVIAEAAADVAALAAWVAAAGAPAQRADAVVAATLAEGAAQACAHLVLINLTIRVSDDLALRARAAASAATASRERALQLSD